MAGNAKAGRWPINLRANRITEIEFPLGLPPGAVIAVETVPQATGKRIDLMLPGRATVRRRKRVRGKSA